ncbi:MAG: GIY-YIG nuclease family protein [Gammaproteobacteria bacterium]
MKKDLYKIYKLIRQRADRDPASRIKNEMALLAKDLVKGGYSVEKMLELSNDLYLLEKQLPRIGKYFSIEIYSALQGNNFIINVPYPIAHAWGESPNSVGYLYVATSKAKPNQVKLGATTLTPRKRLDKYSHRYGYEVELFWQMKVRMPFKLEKIVASKVAGSRVSGLTDGDSNEWYHLTPDKLLLEVETELKPPHLMI